MTLADYKGAVAKYHFDCNFPISTKSSKNLFGLA